jgi:hypothetical protein
MGKFLFLLYIGSASVGVIALVELSVRESCGKLNLFRKIFVCIPVFLLMSSMIFYILDDDSFKSKNSFFTDSTLLLGLLSILILPFVVAMPLRECWNCIGPCWGLYFFGLSSHFFLICYSAGFPCKTSADKALHLTPTRYTSLSYDRFPSQATLNQGVSARSG